MIDSVKNYAASYEFISMLALFTYWIPMLICLSVYLFRFIGMYKADLKKCEDEYYTPTLTIGFIVWCLSISIIPAINLFAMTFDCASSVFKWLGTVLNIPLVRARPSAAE